MANIAKQLFKEAAVAAQSLGFLGRRRDFGNVFHAAAVHCCDIARLIKADAQHHLVARFGRIKRILARVAGEIIIIFRAKLAHPSGAAQSFFNRIAIINAGLNGINQRHISNKALMAGQPRAGRGRQPNGHQDQSSCEFAVHARRPFHNATLPLAEQAATPNMPGADEQQASWDKWMAFGFLKRLFARDEGRDALSPLYRAVIAEARTPDWYQKGNVADTMDGRFEMVAAVTALTLLRLDAEGEPGRVPAVMLTEIFVDDMDGQLRQEGIGDIVVGKHIGKMMASLGGRMDAYRAGLDGGDLEAALIRNLYRTEDPGKKPLAFTAARLRDLWARLCATPLDALLAGTITDPKK